MSKLFGAIKSTTDSTTVDVDAGDLTHVDLGADADEALLDQSPLQSLLKEDKFQSQLADMGKQLGIDPTTSDMGTIMSKIKSMPPDKRDALTADAAKLVSSLPRDKLLELAAEQFPDQADMIKDAGSAMSEEDIKNLLKTTIENTNPDGSINEDAVMKAVGKTVAKNTAGDLKHWITHGFTGARVLGFLGGVGLMVAAVLGVIIDTIVMFAGQKCFEGGEGMIKIVMDVYLAFFGLLIALTEARTLKLLKGIRSYIKHEAHFLNRGLGRGVFYIFVGSVAIGSWDIEGLAKIIFGLWIMIIGIWNIISAAHMNAQLNKQLALKDPEIAEAWSKVTDGSMEDLSLDPNSKPSFTDFLKATGDPVNGKMVKALESATDVHGDGKIGLHEYLNFLHDAQNDHPKNWVMGHAAKQEIEKGHATPAAVAPVVGDATPAAVAPVVGGAGAPSVQSADSSATAAPSAASSGVDPDLKKDQ